MADISGVLSTNGSQRGVAESVQAAAGSLPGSGPSSASLASAGGSAGGGGAGAATPGARLTSGGGSAGGDELAALAYTGQFFNYFSIGGDAQAAHGFHTLREHRPSLAGSRIANQFWYSWFSCSSGWFCNTIPSVSAFTSVEVLRGGQWAPLELPPAVKALVVVNLQSYGGGRNIWGGTMRPEKARARGFVQPSVDDGMVEVVGFTHGWQALTVMATKARAAHAKRLAQGRGVRLTLKGGRPDGACCEGYMQLDGEPWAQRLPSGAHAPPVVVEVYHAGRARVLINREDTRERVRRMSEVMPEGQRVGAYLAGGPPGAGGGAGGKAGAGANGGGGDANGGSDANGGGSGGGTATAGVEMVPGAAAAGLAAAAAPAEDGVDCRKLRGQGGVAAFDAKVAAQHRPPAGPGAK